MNLGKTVRDKISRDGDIITLGDIQVLVQEIWYVEVVFRPPRGFIVLSTIAVILFAVVLLAMIVGAVGSIFYWDANSPVVGRIIGIIFAVGMVGCFGTFAFAMIAYRVEWQVEIATPSGTHVVHSEPSRMGANIYAKRLRRVIGI